MRLDREQRADRRRVAKPQSLDSGSRAIAPGSRTLFHDDEDEHEPQPVSSKPIISINGEDVQDFLSPSAERKPA